ncbi:MAG: polysaccharide deacetylase family protein [Bacteroidales bacterium]|nr:polysaccharide deacetylase family protein [Bacteroidales bacterium]
MKYDVQVYTGKKVTSRLEYAFDLILGNVLGLSYIITDEPDHDLPLINYSDNRAAGGLFIKPEKLLFEENIRRQDIWVAHINGIPLFYQQPPEAGFYLDVFAFGFFLVTRYEEYLIEARDEHGRFAAESSLAFKQDFLNMPVVDIWAHRLGDTLKMLYPSIDIPEKNYRHILTIDIDQPFAYRGKGILRNAGGLLMDFFRPGKPADRLACMLGRKKDPYDTYDYINTYADKYDCTLIYFFTSGGRGKYDKSIKPWRRCYKRLIRNVAEKYEMGLHTSYKSDDDPKIIYREKKNLENVSRKPIDKVRKHYLLLSLPFTYQMLQDIGIKEDYTMGYAREPGFRAGIARPFRYFDLERNEKSSLTVIPFQYMDGTYRKYKKMKPEEAYDSVQKLIERTKEVGGVFVSLWHNTSLTDNEEWKGWRSLFEFTLNKQQK